MLQAGVQGRVLDGDADVAGERFKQLNILARQEVAAGCAAKPQHSDGPVLHAAGQVVMQLQRGGALPFGLREAQRVLRILKKDVRGSARLVECKEAERKRGRRRQTVAGRKSKTAGLAGQENSGAGHKQGLRKPGRDGAQQRVQVGLCSQAAPKLNQRLAIVVALPVK